MVNAHETTEYPVSFTRIVLVLAMPKHTLTLVSTRSATITIPNPPHAIPHVRSAANEFVSIIPQHVSIHHAGKHIQIPFATHTTATYHLDVFA